MKFVQSLLLAGAVLSASPVFASVINFDGALPFANYSSVPTGFGSTSDVTVNYSTLNPDGSKAFNDALLWNTGYATLNSAVFAHSNGYLLDITLTASSGKNVTLNSFDVAAYPGPANFTRNATDLRLLNEDGTILADYAPVGSPFPVPGNSPYTFSPAVTSQSISIILGKDWDNGINNINFSVSAVPIPAAAWLLLSGIFGLGVISRPQTRPI